MRALVAAFHASPEARVVRPVHEGAPGHPTLFARAVFEQLLGPGLRQGAETVVARHAASRVDVTVDDPGVAGNVNTPADYMRLVRNDE